MQRIKYHLSVVLVAVLGTAVLAIAPVSALEDNGTTCPPPQTANREGAQTRCPQQPNSSTASSTSGSSTGEASETEAAEPGVSTTSSDTTTLRQQAAQLLQAKRQNIKQHTEAEKQKACVAHQKDVNARAKAFAADAQSHLTIFNNIFTKVQTYYTNKQLNVASYAGLVAAAQTKQAAAQTAVDSLKGLDVNLDCTSSDPATSVATLKTAVSSARSALQDYRQALKDIIVALQGASTSTSTNTTGGTE